MKVLTHIFAASVIAYFMYRTVRKALDDPPEEFRVYDGPASAEADGVEESFMDTNGEEWRWESF